MLRPLSAVISSCILAACASGLTAQTLSYAGGSQARSMVSAPIDETKLSVLAGNTNPKANAKNDRGAVAENFSLNHMQLVLQRPPELEKELDALMQEQQEKTSPQYHKWLTASQFGERYGVSPSDMEKVKNWLSLHGFQVDSVAASGMSIEFSGTAGQVQKAFHTEIHDLEVDGVKHISNMSDPQIPTALTGVVKGIHSLNDFMPHSMMKKRTKYSQGSGFYTVVPADLATIYNLNPAFKAGYTGAGQTVVVIEDTNVYSAADITTFRSTFGLSGYSGNFTQVHPTGSNTCLNPGIVSGAEGEAELDAEWAGASAPGAAIQLASCSDTLTTFGGLLALQNLISAASVPQIVSISYGECEPENGATANQSYYNTYQQAASEGVSVFVSSGDEGAASCNADESNATHGISVSGFASTPYNVAVGGTDYADTYENTNSDYWSDTNSSTYGSALSYIPEIPWNDSCASQLLATANGYSTTYGTTGFCNSSVGEAEYLTTGSGSGGPSGCYSGSSSTNGVVNGTCVGQTKPSWQSVLGNPADGVRDLPDVSLFAANGVWGHYYIYCDSDTDDGGVACTGAPSGWSGAGGTSFSSPILAGVQALINQATGASNGSGNPNPRFYKLGSLEFGTTGSSTCNSSNSSGPGTSCVFYDVTLGDMDVNCTGKHNCYLPSGSYGVLSTSTTSYTPAYGTQTGWDFATGLGTINAFNLIRDWTLVQSTTAVTSSLNPSSTGQQVTYTATVTPDIGSAETGTISWSSNTNCAKSTLSSGVVRCSVTWPSAGSQTVTATYSGDSNYATSAASVIQTVKSSGGTVSILPTSMAFGTIGVGTTSAYKVATLTNASGATLTGITFSITGANASSFSIPSNHQTCKTTLAAGASCNFDVAMTPTTTGSLAGSVLIRDSATVSPQTIALSGTGGAALTASLSPTTVAFGNVYENTTSAYKVITLTNNGSSALNGITFNLTGTNASKFSIPSNHQACGATLGAGLNCSFDVAMTPTTAGSLSASVQITDNATNSPQTLALTGAGIAPAAASLSTTSIAFGTVAVGSTSGYKTVTLTNTGGATLTVSAVTVTGTNASSFSLPSNHQTCLKALAPGTNCSFDVAFTPTKTGTLTGAVSITDNASGSPQSIALSGTGQ